MFLPKKNLISSYLIFIDVLNSDSVFYNYIFIVILIIMLDPTGKNATYKLTFHVITLFLLSVL